MARTTVRVAIAVTILSLVSSLPAVGRDLPASLRAAVRRGAATIVARGNPARIPLIPSPIPGSPGAYVRVRLNGRGPFVFVFDTGATVSILDAGTVRAANLPVVFHRERNSIVKIRDVDLGGIVLRDAYAFANSGLKDGIGVDGVLGFNSFGALPFRLDSGSLTIFDALPDVRSATKVDLLEDHSGWSLTAVPLIPMTTDSARVPVLIDTGDDGWIDMLPGDVKDLPLARNLRPAHVEYNPETGETRSMVGQAAASFTVAGAMIEHAIFRTDPSLPQSEIGWRLLSQLFPIVFDRAHRAVYVSAANRRPATPFIHSLPFRIRFKGGSATVSDVVPETTPIDGLAAGDRISSINGASPASFDAGSFGELLDRSSSVAIAWIHDGVQISRNIPVLTFP